MISLEQFGLVSIGALVMLLLVCIATIWNVRRAVRWIWGHASQFDGLSAKSAKGKVSLGAELRSGLTVDQTKPAQRRRAKPKKGKSESIKDALFGLSEADKRRQRERETLVQ